MNAPPPERIDVSPPRLNKLVEILRDRPAQDLTNPVARSGTLADSETVNVISVDGVMIEIPETASIETRVDDDRRPGIRIVSDHPLPNGTCVWIPCDAVAHAHEVITTVARC